MMIKRYLLTPSLLFVLSLGGPSAVAQTGEFDLEKTKTVLSGLIEDALRDRGVPSISIALVRGDEIVWTAAFGYANVRMQTPATTETSTPRRLSPTSTRSGRRVGTSRP